MFGLALLRREMLSLCVSSLKLGVPLLPLVPVTANPRHVVQSLFRNSSHMVLTDLRCLKELRNKYKLFGQVILSKAEVWAGTLHSPSYLDVDWCHCEATPEYL